MFTGTWANRQSCGYEHPARINFVQTGTQVRGTWSDGTRLSG